MSQFIPNYEDYDGLADYIIYSALQLSEERTEEEIDALIAHQLQNPFLSSGFPDIYDANILGESATVDEDEILYMSTSTESLGDIKKKRGLLKWLKKQLCQALKIIGINDILKALQEGSLKEAIKQLLPIMLGTAAAGLKPILILLLIFILARLLRRRIKKGDSVLVKFCDKVDVDLRPEK